MRKRYLSLFAILLFIFSLPAFAHSGESRDYSEYKSVNNTWWHPSRIYLGAFGGYGNVNGGYSNDGQVTLGRLALGIHAAEYKVFSFGAELGVESGNDMRLSIPSSLLATTAGLPVQATLKPFFDFLIVVETQVLPNYPLIGILKGGIAYRQMQLVGSTSSGDSLQKVNGEFQAGLGYGLTEHAMLSAYYQGIYSGNSAGLGLDSSGNVTLGRIPTEQAGFLGLEFSL